MIEEAPGPGSRGKVNPPYAGGEDKCGKGLVAPADLERTADRLTAIKGAIILSINDTAEICALVDRFTIEPVSLTYTVSRREPTQAAERLISSRWIDVKLFGRVASGEATAARVS